MRTQLKLQTREFYRAAYENTKRLKEEEKRWERFLIDRAEFDEALERTLDAWEFMMKNGAE